MNFTYFWIDLLSLIPPLALSFHPRLKFHLHWKHLLPSLFFIAFLFILWDVYYTHLGVWGFNKKYLLGIQLYNLPIEEILFFICIPYACAFSYHCLNTLVPKDIFGPYQRILSSVLIFFLIVIGCLFAKKLYTAVAFFSLAILIIYLELFAKVVWLGRFYFAYLVLLVPFTIVNGILTGTGLKEPIVWYNPNEFMGYRYLTIPFEDIFYGMLLVLASITLYERSKEMKVKRTNHSTTF